uniref:Bromo domain-containing protein n=1 Tax=Noccaea caerulescens TaxID=107243 RepID=A0A1J3CYW2_NOCCA
MVMMMMTKAMATDWGTWEELLLGGAVLRHGTGDWSVVADELRSHSLPEIFTPEICRAKYKDLRERYLGCKTWFDELKKKRVAELKAALLKSDDSIGSLESKLQSLKSESNDHECNKNNYDSSRTVSLEPSPKSEGGGECTSKDTSKDLSSAGSFTQQELTTTTTTNWSPEAIKSEAPAMIIKEEEKIKNLLHGDIFESVYGGQVLPSMRKKRGKRKRKDCSGSTKEVTEVSAVEESDLLDSSTADIATISRSKESKESKEASSSSSSQIRGHGLASPEELMKIYNTIAQNECALVFRRRLDSQKRRRYTKLVRRHMDLDTMKSRINGCLISSAKELFMDFLLVANNAAIFYSKNTREHKSAVCLRDIVTKSLRHYLTEDHHPPHRSSSIITSTKVPVLPSASTSPAVRTSQADKKPRTGTHPLKKVEQDMVKTSSGRKKRFVADSPAAAVKTAATGKKGAAVERRRDGRQATPAVAGRKRNRVR